MFACTLFGIDRQVYYRKIKRRFIKQNKARLVVDMVIEIRQQMPRIGAKKLYYLLNQDLINLKIGRDKFIDILRANHLLIVPKRSYHITTNSHHRFRKYNNQILDLTRWVKLNDLNFDIINWSVKDKFIDILH